jgi:hypothetical protein
MSSETLIILQRWLGELLDAFSPLAVAFGWRQALLGNAESRARRTRF